MKNVLINRTLCSMVVWRRCSGSCAGQTRDRGRLEFCCRPPRLYGTAWLAHRPCRRTLKTAGHTGSAYSSTRLPTSNKTAAHKLLVLQIKRKAQTPGSECVTHILSAPVCSTHFRAALHSLYWGRCFRDLENLNIFAHGTYHPLIYTGEEL